MGLLQPERGQAPSVLLAGLHASTAKGLSARG